MKQFEKSVLLFVLILVSGCQNLKNKPNDKTQSQTPPKLLKPGIKKIWIPEIIKNGGTEWEEGHYLYRIQRDTSWSR